MTSQQDIIRKLRPFLEGDPLRNILYTWTLETSFPPLFESPGDDESLHKILEAMGPASEERTEAYPADLRSETRAQLGIEAIAELQKLSFSRRASLKKPERRFKEQGKLLSKMAGILAKEPDTEVFLDIKSKVESILQTTGIQMSRDWLEKHCSPAALQKIGETRRNSLKEPAAFLRLWQPHGRTLEQRHGKGYFDERKTLLVTTMQTIEAGGSDVVKAAMILETARLQKRCSWKILNDLHPNLPRRSRDVWEANEELRREFYADGRKLIRQSRAVKLDPTVERSHIRRLVNSLKYLKTPIRLKYLHRPAAGRPKQPWIDAARKELAEAGIDIDEQTNLFQATGLLPWPKTTRQ